jgi:hypothetical protein
MTAAASRRVASACLVLFVAAAAAAAEPVRLRYEFHPDERMAMRVAHRALTETTMNGTTQSVETMTDSTKTWRVVAVDAAESRDHILNPLAAATVGEAASGAEDVGRARLALARHHEHSGAGPRLCRCTGRPPAHPGTV